VKAIVQDRYGTSTVLENRQIDTPQIESRQVLIRVRAAGVNPADWAVMNGLPYIARPLYGLTRPKAAVRGTDVAGVVERIGPDVTRFRVGDEVFGSANGSHAEYATAEEDGLALKPTDLDFTQAATVPMAGLVALQALRDHADVRPGQRVLINGASGGIGTFAVQIAKALGAEVTAVCGTGNLDLVRSLGADHVVDYTEVDFTRTGETYDVILDNVGNHSLSQTRRALAPTGTLFSNGGQFGNRWTASAGRLAGAKLLAPFVSHTFPMFVVAHRHEDLTALADLIESGKVTPVIDRTFPLARAAEAIAHVGTGHSRGKVAITVGPTA
jgi:NADPH:quinone reductase-like Zn-dependent oxidoreductase